MTDPAAARTIQRQQLQVAAGRAVRLEIESTGLLPLPRGTLVYAYIIDLGSGGVLVVSTTSLAGPD